MSRPKTKGMSIRRSRKKKRIEVGRKTQILQISDSNNKKFQSAMDRVGRQEAHLKQKISEDADCRATELRRVKETLPRGGIMVKQSNTE